MPIASADGNANNLVPEWDDWLKWERKSGPITATKVLRGSVETNLAVILASAPSIPTKSDLQLMWRDRSHGGVNPVLVTVTYEAQNIPLVALLGLDDDAVPVMGLAPELADQLVRDALEMASLSALHSEVRRRLGTFAAGVASGVRNEGLFASHVLEQQPQTTGWIDLCESAKPLLAKRGEGLLNGLGYTVEPVPEGRVLRGMSGSVRSAAAVLLADGESFDNPLGRLHGSNAVSHGLALARREHLDWLVVLGGPVIRLYPVDPDVGVGRKGQTQTFVELDLSFLTTGQAGFLTLLLSPDSLRDNGTITQLLSDSVRFAAGLSERLRDRIYSDVIPPLAIAVADKLGVADLPQDEQKSALDEAYHQSMIILFRLLFVAYAEDRKLLPYEVSDRYTRNALKTLALDILTDPDQLFDKNSTTLWDDLTQVWKVIDTGDLHGWGVPAYNGGLFTHDKVKYPSGAATYELDLTNSTIGPVLRGLLIDDTRDGTLGAVDFRSLSVREFGTIYEGLLESGLGVAETDLSLDAKDTYVPTKRGDEVVVSEGDVYFHSRSGSRKATGSYFTKPFAVEHLLDTALEPALDTHLGRIGSLLTAGATKSAAEALFDFRVADLSMGSAHFLVAAVDRIEARFSAFLIENPLPEVAVELHGLRTVAAKQLGLDPAESGIDDGMLLRRQIARRCIYGLDINEIAVELARLGLWIHTFVPGLPLSFLNHGLTWGNSLTGVGTLSEIGDALADAEKHELTKKDATQSSTLNDALDEFMARASAHLSALGSLVDASVGDVAQAGELQAAMQASLAPLSALCDLITAERATRHLGHETIEVIVDPGFGQPTKKIKKSTPHPGRVLLTAQPEMFTALTADALETAVLAHPHRERAQKIAASVMAAHMPVKFPEVFRRARPGFDCILGNPPWEKIKVEENQFWGARFSGIRNVPAATVKTEIARRRAERPDLVVEYNRQVVVVNDTKAILAAGPFPRLSRSDIDLYQVFAWRFWWLVRESGFVGVVMPRNSLVGKSLMDWRKLVLEEGEFTEVLTLANNRKWVFSEVEAKMTFALVCIRKEFGANVVHLRGPYASHSEFLSGIARSPAEVPAGEVANWTGSCSLPQLSDEATGEVFRKMQLAARLDLVDAEWCFPATRELHATDDKPLFDLSGTLGSSIWPVYTGESFDRWNPDTGTYYASITEETAFRVLLQKAQRGQKMARSVYSRLSADQVLDSSALPASRPRIAFRDVTNEKNTRTVIAALIPPRVTLTHQANFVLRAGGSERTEAYLLAFLSSVPLDWYARRFVDGHMTLDIYNGLPIPRPSFDTEIAVRVIEISGRLAAIDSRFSDWAEAVCVPVGSVKTESEKNDLIYELDALVAILYGLTEGQLTTVFETFHRGWDYKPRLDAVLIHFKAWNGKFVQAVAAK